MEISFKVKIYKSLLFKVQIQVWLQRQEVQVPQPLQVQEIQILMDTLGKIFLFCY